MDARIAKLESDVGHILRDISDMRADLKDIKKEARDDFRLLFGALIATTLALGGMIGHGFKWF